MQKRGLLIVVVMFGLLTTGVSCATKTMPEGELVSVRYTRSGTMAGYIYEGEMTKEQNGDVVLRAMKESYGPLFEKCLTTAEVQHFRQIIEEEKMYTYKERYLPRVQVLDGESWSFCAKFSDGTIIDSHGSNASPKGNGLGRIRSYMEQLVQDGQKVEN